MAVTRTPPRKVAKNADMKEVGSPELLSDKEIAIDEQDMGLEILITGPHISVNTSYIKRFGAKMLEVAILDPSIESLTIKNSTFENTFDILSLIEIGLHNPKLRIEFDHSISPEQTRQETFRASLAHLTEKMRERIRFDMTTQNIVDITKLMDRVYQSPKIFGGSPERLFVRKPQEKTVLLPSIKANAGVEMKDSGREAQPIIKVSTAKRGRYDDRPILGSINAPAATKKGR
ncbi:MAG: hypothetical protein ACYCQI_04870 [Gammaproteobacteria bacterium]